MSVGRFLVSLLGLCALGFLLFACEDVETDREAEAVSVQTVGDTTVVTTRRPATLDTARMTRTARIGRGDAPGDFLLMSVPAFTVGWRGEVYVAGEGIRVFSPDGSGVRRIASSGQGPGEVANVTGMEVDGLGRLLALDLENQRVATFDTSGAFLAHWPLPHDRLLYGRQAVVPVPEQGTLVGMHPPVTPGGSGFPRPIFLRLDSAGTIQDTLFAPARFRRGCTPDDPHFKGGLWQDFREPMFPKLKWTAGRTGEIVYGCPSEYVVDRLQPDGSLLRIVHQRDPMVEPPEVRSSFVEVYEIFNSRGGNDWSWRGPEPPERKPYYHRLIVGRHGRLWVWPGHLRQPVPNPMPPFSDVWVDPRTGTFDVFDPEGRFLGPVQLPEGITYQWHPGTQAPFFAGDTVWMVRQDSLNVHYIDRMEIQW